MEYLRIFALLVSLWLLSVNAQIEAAASKKNLDTPYGLWMDEERYPTSSEFIEEHPDQRRLFHSKAEIQNFLNSWDKLHGLHGRYRFGKRSTGMDKASWSKDKSSNWQHRSFPLFLKPQNFDNNADAD